MPIKAASALRNVSLDVLAGIISVTTRRTAGRRLMFEIGLFTKLELGMVTRCPTLVRTFVERKPMSSIVPSNPLAFTESPIRNERSSKMATDPNRCFSESWAASDTAKPAIPMPASHAAMSCPENSSGSEKHTDGDQKHPQRTRDQQDNLMLQESVVAQVELSHDQANHIDQIAGVPENRDCGEEIQRSSNKTNQEITGDLQIRHSDGDAQG